MLTGGVVPWEAPPDSAGLPWVLDISADPVSWKVRPAQPLPRSVDAAPAGPAACDKQLWLLQR